ncbi:MAG: hypothetical protein GXC73_19010 [Chitinophagaceae bacterium]|nr:hypothetical protein [Chitinophagaceae bacterium]
MEVKNMFEREAFEEIYQRLQNLTINHQRQWGKMTAAQMLTHCKEAYKVPLTSKPLKRHPISYIAWLFRPALYNSRPYGKSLPTAPNFIVKD